MMRGPMYLSPAMRAGQARRDVQRYHGRVSDERLAYLLDEYRKILDSEKAEREAGHVDCPADECEKQRPYMVAAIENLLMKRGK